MNKLAKHNGSVFEFISKKGSKSIFSKGNNSGVYLDEEQIMKIKNGKYTSYSFLTHRENLPKNVVENLVVEQVNDTLRAYLIRYQYSDRYMDNLAKGVKNQRFDGTIIRTGYHTDLDALLKMEEPSSVHENLTRMTFNRVCYDINLIISYSCNSGKHFVGDDRCALSGSARAHNEYRTVTKCYNEIDYGWTPPMEQIDHIADDYLGGGGGTPPSAPAVVVNIKRERADGGATEIEDDGYIIDEIIDQITNEKIKCLHDKLRNGNNDYVKEIFSKFEGNGTEFDIVISSENKVLYEGREVNAKTTFTRGSKAIHIRISESKAVGRSALDIAKTIFHEYIHADIHRKIQTGDVSNPSDFKSVYEKYKSEREEQYQHEMMGKLYVETMRDALKKFHKEVMPQEYAYFKESYFDVSINEDVFYEVLAWQGLKEHNIDAYLEKVKKDSNFPDTVKHVEQVQKSLTQRSPCE
ncbi:hypothetical protein CGC49_10890 [Capnocytophaga sp. H4358]|uniref:hypothetical protein n=1 Tax=Capnocytophaga sp. H4358 TaxID=1945658 RepID=UPI000BB18F9D|nr:hypothetical protein [Capnocytophaga sp. H4358]ATA73729.1 hypothetical protein CGC49_10890 [Capnocytophaga sp. H4358]